MFNEHGESMMSFAEAVKNGRLSYNDAARQQRSASGTITGRKGEGINVTLQGGAEKTFLNSADALRWVNQTGGILYERDTEGKQTVAMGESVDEIFKRVGKMAA